MVFGLGILWDSCVCKRVCFYILKKYSGKMGRRKRDWICGHTVLFKISELISRRKHSCNLKWRTQSEISLPFNWLWSGWWVTVRLRKDCLVWRRYFYLSMSERSSLPCSTEGLMKHEALQQGAAVLNEPFHSPGQAPESTALRSADGWLV